MVEIRLAFKGRIRCNVIRLPRTLSRCYATLAHHFFPPLCLALAFAFDVIFLLSLSRPPHVSILNAKGVGDGRLLDWWRCLAWKRIVCRLDPLSSRIFHTGPFPPLSPLFDREQSYRCEIMLFFKLNIEKIQLFNPIIKKEKKKRTTRMIKKKDFIFVRKIFEGTEFYIRCVYIRLMDLICRDLATVSWLE